MVSIYYRVCIINDRQSTTPAKKNISLRGRVRARMRFEEHKSKVTKSFPEYFHQINPELIWISDSILNTSFKPTLNKRKKNWWGTSSKVYPIMATQRFYMSSSIMERRWSFSGLCEHYALFSSSLFLYREIEKEFSSLYILCVKLMKFWWDRRETDSGIFLIIKCYDTLYYIRKIGFRMSLCSDKGISQDLCLTVLISNSKTYKYVTFVSERSQSNTCCRCRYRLINKRYLNYFPVLSIVRLIK